MNETLIHPTAIVSPKAELGTGVSVGPFSIIEDDVQVGDNTEIRSSVVLANGARIGSDCRIHSSCVIATEPQDLKYKNERTYAFVGDRTVLREYVTVNRGTVETGKAVVGDDCLIMTYCHVAHDCRVGNNVIMSNVSQLAGHVTIEDWVILGGVAKIHQFCTVGSHSMIGADVKIVKDVPPFTLVGRQPAKVEGVNKIGLRRRGFKSKTIRAIEEFYDTVLFSGMNNTEGIKHYKAKGDLLEEVEYCIKFIENSKRGIHR